MMVKQLFLFLLFTGSLFTSASSQEVRIDSTGVVKGEVKALSHEDLELVHSPKKATILSACLPGAGQIYNKKWWKAPIVWGGIGTSLYLSQQHRNDYHFWKDQYVRRIDPDLEDDYPNAATRSLENQMNTYRKWMETSYIVAGVIYVLQILDANVDAQLMSFDVSDDLSLNVQPNLYIDKRQQQATYGLTLRLGFK